MQLIGAEAVCSWIVNMPNDISFIIDLKSTSNIAVDSNIIIKSSVIQYICLLTNNGFQDLQNNLNIPSIYTPSTQNVPNIMITSLSTSIGVCDNLILDARGTTNLGGRDGTFIWILSIEGSNINKQYNGSYIDIDRDLLQKDVIYNIELTVTNWYKASSRTYFSVYVSNKATPRTFIDGVSEYKSTNLNLNGLLNMYGEIKFNDTCLQETDKNLEYDIIWTVKHEMIHKNDTLVIDEDMELKLVKFLEIQSNEEISIEVDEYLQSGLIYTFIMNVKCKGDYECNIDSIHELIYDYGDIQCQISTNDILLKNVDPINDLNDVIMELNGLLFTFDPDNIATNDHLLWDWDCIDYDGRSCSDLLDNTNSEIVNADLSTITFEYDSYYLFTFTMIVWDETNSYRDTCIDSVIFEISTKSASTNTNNKKLLILSVTAIKTEININDRLQLIGNILNYKQSDLMFEGIMDYEWNELNGFLNDDDILNNKETSNDTMNLILSEGVLEYGKIYSFQLIVTQYDENKKNIIGYGISSEIIISVLKEPTIITQSFIINPKCKYQYTSIIELLSTSYSLSLSSDALYTPLLYQFGLKYNHNTNTNIYYFHSQYLYHSSLSNVFLPIGEFIIFGNVIDSKSSITSDTIQCSISLKLYSICLEDFDKDIIEPFLAKYPLISLSEKYSFLFQQSSSYLQYLYQYIEDDEDDQCLTDSLNAVLSATICNTLHPILLSQTITLWMHINITEKQCDH